MKTQTMKSLLASALVIATLFFSSCQDDNENPSKVNDPVKVAQAEKILALRDELSFIERFVIDDASEIPSGENGRRSSINATVARIQDSAPCSDVTEEELPNGSVKITMDFGDGCQTDEGIEVAGKVVMIFAFNENTLEFSLEFVDYTEFNTESAGDIANGTVSGRFVMDLETGEFIQEMEQDLTITNANGLEARLVMEQAAEMTESGMRVTSMATSGNLSSGEEFSVTVTKALLYDFACEDNYPVEGVERMTFQGNTIVVNYGNGTCDGKYDVN